MDTLTWNKKLVCMEKLSVIKVGGAILENKDSLCLDSFAKLGRDVGQHSLEISECLTHDI